MVTILFIVFVLIASPVLGAPPNLVAEPNSNKKIFEAYAYLKILLGIQPNRNITMNQFLAFVEPSDYQRNLLRGYFLIFPKDNKRKDDIDFFLFTCLIRHICIGCGKDPLCFLNEILSKPHIERMEESLAIRLTMRN